MKKMKYVLSIFLIAVLVLASCGPKEEENTDTSFVDIKNKGEFVLGCDSGFPPMGYEEDGELKGFDIDLAKAVAEKLGVKLVTKAINWETKEMELESRKIDVIWNGYTINAERNKKVEYTKPYLNNQQVIVVKRGSKIKKASDLKGKVVGVQTESGAESVINEDEELKSSLKELRQYENYEQAMLDLKSANRIDAVAGDLIFIQEVLKKNPGVFKVTNIVLDDEYYGIGFRKGAIKLREEVDKALDELYKDGTIAKISKKWFGKNIVIRDVPKLTDEELLAG